MTITKTRLREIIVNGRRLASAAETLAALLAEEGLADVKVATAVNGDFVPERRRADTRLADGDRIEILSVRQGG
jgi:sulfur carrier protein